jgi:hypothetical protein
LAPANPTGKPNFNLKNRPEVNKLGPGENSAKKIGVFYSASVLASTLNLGSFNLLVIYGGRCYKHSANKLVDILLVDILGVDLSSIYGSQYIVGRYIVGRYIVGRYIAVDREKLTQ